MIISIKLVKCEQEISRSSVEFKNKSTSLCIRFILEGLPPTPRSKYSGGINMHYIKHIYILGPDSVSN